MPNAEAEDNNRLFSIIATALGVDREALDPIHNVDSYNSYTLYGAATALAQNFDQYNRLAASVDAANETETMNDEQMQQIADNLLDEYRDGGRAAVEDKDMPDELEPIREKFIELAKNFEKEWMADQIAEADGSDLDADEIKEAPYNVVTNLAESVGVTLPWSEYGGGGGDAAAANVDASNYPSLSARAFMREKKEHAENVSQNGNGSSFPSLSAGERAKEIGGDD